MVIFEETTELFSHTVRGTVVQCDERRLRVRALGSIWNAVLDSSWGAVSPTPGQVVQVVGRKGIRLLVTQ